MPNPARHDKLKPIIREGFLKKMKFKQHGKRFDWRALLAVWLTLAFLTAAGFAAYCAWQTSRIGFAVHFVDVGQGDGAIVVCD